MDGCLKKRKLLVNEYRRYLDNIDGIQLNVIQENVEPNYAYFPIVIDEKQFGSTRNEVMSKLANEGIFARKYFYPLTNTFDAFHGKYDVKQTPIALHISKRVLTLPLYEELDINEVSRIAEIILSLYKIR